VPKLTACARRSPSADLRKKPFLKGGSAIRTKHSPELEDRVAQLVRTGSSLGVAAHAVGVHEQTLYHWLRTRASFKVAVERARADAEAALVGRVQHAAKAGSWRAATWLLEREFPERWAPLGERAHVDRELDRELDRILGT